MTATLRPVACAIALVVLAGLSTGPARAQEITFHPYAAPVVRVGQDLVVRADQEVGEAIVVAGSATIDGHVRNDLYVWLGDVRLGSTAIIDGSLVVVAGDLTVAPGAIVDDDLVVVGGTVDRPEAFEPGREQVTVGFPEVGHGLRSLVPWITRGLLLGRPIVPELQWVWQIVAVTFGLGLVLSLLFHGPVGAAAKVVVERPLSVLLTGILVLLLSGPLLVIVSATIVGIAALPVVLCAMAVAWTIGKVGVARGIGHRIFRESDAESRPQSVRSFVIGFLLITAAYMVPVLGFVTWSLVSVFGIGAATMSMLSALRREYPARKRAPKGATPSTPGSVTPPVGGEASPASASASVFANESPSADADILDGLSGEPLRASAQTSRTGLLGYPRASFLDRAAAFGLDCILVAMVGALFDIMDDGGYFLLLAGYFIGFWTWQGTTLGGIVVGLRVVRTDGSQPRLVDSLIRALASLFSFGVLAIGVLWMIQDPERQTWHDKIAGTYVVRVPRELALARDGSSAG